MSASQWTERGQGWVTQFITELVVRTNPPVPAKFAKTVAMHQWLRTARGCRTSWRANG
jgi:hypothetical protein